MLSTYRGLSDKTSWDYIHVSGGMNNSVELVSNTMSEYQTLINEINQNKKSGAKLIIHQMTPALNAARWVGNETLYNAIQDSIAGIGPNAVNGADYVDTNIFTGELNDGAGSMKTIYDNGDHVHPNFAGAKIGAGIYNTYHV